MAGKKKPDWEKKGYKSAAAYHMSDEYKKKVSAGRTPRSAKKVARKEKVRKYVSGVKKKVREYHAERGQKRAEKALKGMGGAVGLPQKKSKSKPKKSKSSVFHLKKGTKVRKGAVGVKKTKGGEYVKYGKKSEAAGSFRKAFKAGCAGGAKSFSWDGRSYSCKKK